MKSKKARPKSKSEPNSATPLLPKELRALFKTPALLPNEDPARYQELIDQLTAAILPTNAIEMMLVEDIGAYTNAIGRLRQFGVSILMAGQKDATADYLGMIADQGDFKEISRRQAGLAEAHVSMSGKPDDREYIRLKLRRFGVTFDGIYANAFTENQGVLDRLDRLEAEAVKRRYDCLRELDRYRKTLGDRVRNFIDAFDAREVETAVEAGEERPAETKVSVEPEAVGERLGDEEVLHVAEELSDEPDTAEED